MEEQVIVLNFTKIKENSIVLHTLSRSFGRRSFVVRVNAKTGMAWFLPLNIIDLNLAENQKTSLWAARPASARYALAGIRNNIYKNTMTLFMAEVLYRTIKDGAMEDGLFDWCERQILTLDALEADFSNYHIRFLLELCVALGFRPEKSCANSTDDTLRGRPESVAQRANCEAPERTGSDSAGSHVYKPSKGTWRIQVPFFRVVS